MNRSPIALALALCTTGIQAQPVTIKVTKVVEDVEFRSGGGSWQEAVGGEVLGEQDEISTGPGSQATLQFPDQSTLVMKEITQLKVAYLLKDKSSARTRLLLKVGEVEAQVNPGKTVSSDFSVSTPVATASVRGTKINQIRFYPGLGMTTELLNGALLVESNRGRFRCEGQDRSQVSNDTTLSTQDMIVQEDARCHIQPDGLTDSEVDQINVANQPRIGPVSGQIGENRPLSSTLIFRFQLDDDGR